MLGAFGTRQGPWNRVPSQVRQLFQNAAIIGQGRASHHRSLAGAQVLLALLPRKHPNQSRAVAVSSGHAPVTPGASLRRSPSFRYQFRRHSEHLGPVVPHPIPGRPRVPPHGHRRQIVSAGNVAPPHRAAMGTGRTVIVPFSSAAAKCALPMGPRAPTGKRYVARLARGAPVLSGANPRTGLAGPCSASVPQ